MRFMLYLLHKEGMSMLDFRMYTFITLSKSLNYTQAAKKLCITQPAVTQHIKYLENYYDVKLFQHDHKQLTLTKQGKILQEHIQRIAADEEHLKEMIKANVDTVEHVRFGATRTIGEFILPEKLSHMLLAHPDISFTMVVENTQILLKMLQDGEIDFAFIEGYFNKNDVSYRLLSAERFIAVTAGGQPQRKQPTSFYDLCKKTLILREKGSGTREVLERSLNEKNISIHDFHRIIEIGDIHVIKDLVARGHGISFLYEAAVKKELEKGALQMIPLQDFHTIHECNFVSLKGSMFQDIYERFLDKLHVM